MTVEVVVPFRQTSVRADFSELQRELYRTFEMDYFTLMKGTISSSFYHQKMCKVEQLIFQCLISQGFRFVFLVSRD